MLKIRHAFQKHARREEKMDLAIPFISALFSIYYAIDLLKIQVQKFSSSQNEEYTIILDYKEDIIIFILDYKEDMIVFGCTSGMV